MPAHSPKALAMLGGVVIVFVSLGFDGRGGEDLEFATAIKYHAHDANFFRFDLQMFGGKAVPKNRTVDTAPKMSPSNRTILKYDSTPPMQEMLFCFS